MQMVEPLEPTNSTRCGRDLTAEAAGGQRLQSRRRRSLSRENEPSLAGGDPLNPTSGPSRGGTRGRGDPRNRFLWSEVAKSG